MRSSDCRRIETAAESAEASRLSATPPDSKCNLQLGGLTECGRGLRCKATTPPVAPPGDVATPFGAGFARGADNLGRLSEWQGGGGNCWRNRRLTCRVPARSGRCGRCGRCGWRSSARAIATASRPSGRSKRFRSPLLGWVSDDELDARLATLGKLPVSRKSPAMRILRGRGGRRCAACSRPIAATFTAAPRIAVPNAILPITKPGQMLCRTGLSVRVGRGSG